jgi:hypothetical protein
VWVLGKRIFHRTVEFASGERRLIIRPARWLYET